MIKVRWLILFLLLTAITDVRGQYNKEFKRIFLDAEYLYQTEFYEEAFNRYKNLLRLDPGNSNVLFRCGACCLNIPAREEQSISYLKEAAEGVNLSYVVRSQTETGAPVLTYFMLARAYHLKNDFDLATKYYNKYIESGVNEDLKQVEYARLQIQACARAKQMVEKPPAFLFESILDQFDEDLPSCNNPVVSGDGNILLFLVDYPSDKKIMMTTRSGKTWSNPRSINSELGMVGETYPTSLSFDGTELYLVHKYYSHSDILISRFEDHRWSKVELLNHHINKRTSEAHASISRDGNKLYFTSDRRGGIGSFDIYVSTKESGKDWGPPENLGPEINTPYEEHTPFISSNDSVLFFSSQGHATIGGHDVLFSEKGKDGTWQEPLNIGYPVNTTGDNLFFNPGWGEFEGYYAIRKASDPGSNSINMVIEIDPDLQADIVESADTAFMPEKTVTIETVSEPDDITAIVVALEPEESTTITTITSTGPFLLRLGIPFDFNDFALNLAAILEAEKILDLMQKYPDTRIEITGHTDAKGLPEYNVLLSMQRAYCVAQYLTGKGIHPDRISIHGKGETEPLARNQNPDGTDAPVGRFLNRQVSVCIFELEQKDLGPTEIYVPNSIKPHPSERGDHASTSVKFTVQIMAAKRPLKMTHFRGLDNVNEFVCKDGYYRYTCEIFDTFEEALEKLNSLQESGYPGPFIQTLEWYHKASL